MLPHAVHPDLWPFHGIRLDWGCCRWQVQRLAALEKLVKKLNLQPQGSGHVAGAVAGKGPDDRLLRRLGSDLALVKKRLDELAPRDPGALLMMREGDHAMLASKPIQGYRYIYRPDEHIDERIDERIDGHLDGRTDDQMKV